nr:right-handed parallel beta-helix repeat-containing protein [Micromonospora sp. DSM 115978]
MINRSTRCGAVRPARRVRLVGLQVAATLLTGLAVLSGLTPAHALPVPRQDENDAAATAREDGERQAALVAAEDRRLNQVRAITAVAPLQGTQWTRPYRLDTGSGYTLVLTERTNPYTVADLLRLAPQTFTRQPDGSYLLTENIYLNSGAKLKLANPGGLTLRMASTKDGFVSIVSFGGGLNLAGTAQAPLKISSWNQGDGTTDTDPLDGRAYLRAIGGQFAMSYAEISDLGFWSGRTGGLALTGTDRPNTGNLEGPTEITPDEEEETLRSGEVTAQPSGELDTPDSRFTVPNLSYVSGEITNSTLSGNAFGLFVSSADGITIGDTTIQGSLNDGLVLHRFVSGAVVERVTAKGNGGDGFILSRATQQVRVTGSTAEGNTGNGYTLSGEPLADGPSASGASIASYGGNSVSSSTARDNGHYGVEVIGGVDVGVQNNTIEGGDMGIVAREGTRDVSITGNQLTGQDRQGIAVRDGVAGAVVTGNVVRETETGVYLRDAVAEIRGNTVQDVTNHGITLVGNGEGSTVSFNVVAGVGPSAIDTPRAHGDIEIKENQTFAWYDTRSFWVKFRHYASPMTMLWTGILLLIVFSALRGAGARRRSGIRDPYEDKRPVTGRVARELTAARGRAQVPVGIR